MAAKGTTKATNTTKKSSVVPIKKTKPAAAVAAPAKKKAAPKADSKYIGKTSGLRVQAFQDKLMKDNYKAKLTDAELAKAMRVEFPNAVAFEEKHVAGIRSQFNNGRRASQDSTKPAKPLAKFDDEGNEVNPRAVGRKAAPATAKKTAGGKKKTAPVEEEEEEEEEVDEEESDDDEDEEVDE